MSDFETPQNSSLSPIDGPLVNADVYEELRRLATIRMAAQSRYQTMQATALVHEVWLRLGDADRQHWQNRAHFYASAATTMRHILIDQARRKLRQRHGGGHVRVGPQTMDQVAIQGRSDDVLLVDEALTELEKVHPQQAQIVVAKFYGGLTSDEVAEGLGLSLRSVERQWALAKVWLLRWIEQTRRS